MRQLRRCASRDGDAAADPRPSSKAERPKSLDPAARTTAQLWFEVSAVLCLAYFPWLFMLSPRPMWTGETTFVTAVLIYDPCSGPGFDACVGDSRIGQGPLVGVWHCSPEVDHRCVLGCVICSAAACSPISSCPCCRYRSEECHVLLRSRSNNASRDIGVSSGVDRHHRRRFCRGTGLSRIPDTEIRASSALDLACRSLRPRCSPVATSTKEQLVRSRRRCRSHLRDCVLSAPTALAALRGARVGNIVIYFHLTR